MTPSSSTATATATPAFATKRVLVTGGNSGIGYAIAEKFLQEGATVAITGRREDKNKETVDQLNKGAVGSARALYITSDLSKEDQIEVTAKKAVELLGGLDILVHNAGVGGFAAVDQAASAYAAIMDTNLRAPILLTSYLVPELRKSAKDGHHPSIIFISSIVTAIHAKNFGIYSASKAGLTHYAKTAAYELTADGVRVNIVSPGPTRTPIFSASSGANAEKAKEMFDEIAAKSPVGRIGEPSEIADSVLFLASEKALYLTGSDLFIDGGYSLVSA
ncbi:mitochondrial short chain dehydrogenase/reductase family protein [Andalucia godoyi]|uniref:Mitochondrial short chain dehydrogenase/reductase family protein n=1 Tax=Andalucia godoyi TaxID=505711 RepID=A0A8K0AG94_ANDGO|nr:mitochondrial short chain dehydrogenase/reductase family protein [Andalucia godoyi]|eukprot:ANDGO_00899.mRNA.1 mitochondrial short chain dehydrogenase/reductase family protein